MSKGDIHFFRRRTQFFLKNYVYLLYMCIFAGDFVYNKFIDFMYIDNLDVTSKPKRAYRGSLETQALYFASAQ